MHEVAELVNNNVTLGGSGALVSINQIEKLYGNTAATKVNKYRCANKKCGVQVTAVIPLKNKPYRKKSPCAYFAARPNSHITGCSREPTNEKDIITPSSGAVEPNPNRRTAPTIWINPESPPVAGGAGDKKAEGQIGGTNNTNGQNRNSGQSTSDASSQLMKRFASEWKSMSLNERQSTPLGAPWNTGGTYYSAFLPLKFYPNIDISTIKERMFVGQYSNIYKGSSGYIITLKEKDISGLELKIWIQNVTFSKGSSGKALENHLKEISENPRDSSELEIYILGQFLKQNSNTGSYSWYSVPVTNSSVIWIQ